MQVNVNLEAARRALHFADLVDHDEIHIPASQFWWSQSLKFLEIDAVPRPR